MWEGWMMVERRYGFRFSGAEGGVLLGSILISSFLIFVSGVYVGREVAGRKGVSQNQVVRVPASSFGDPVASRTTSASDPLTVRTPSVNAPLTWPVEKEKTTPPVPSLVRRQELQPREKEKSEPPHSQESASVAVASAPHMRSSPLVNEKNNVPSRSKPALEPFTPKIVGPVATRMEKAAPAMLSRMENGDGKLAAITVAHVEKVEPPARPRGSALEVKRSSDGKGNEAKSVQVPVKKVAKQTPGWRVQVGATTYQETAQDIARELRELGYDPLVSRVQMNGETLYRVRIGKFGKQGEAVAAVGRFRREGRFSQAYLVSE